jgi:branched-chain amino acid transport system ATP-binding protein
MLLATQNVSTFYGQIQALNSVHLQVGEGEIVAIIGANGAGKTTLLNTVCGVHSPREGKVIFCDQDITRLPAERIVRLGISHVPERRQVFGTMSTLDNLILGAYHRYVKERQNQMAGTLSGGEQQMLAIGRGLMARPQLLLLDEPSLGLAPLLVREIFRVMTDLREHGTTILLVEQNARAALRIADRAYVLETGTVALEGTAEELLADERVQSAYLGKGYR